MINQLEQYLHYCYILYPDLQDWIYLNLKRFLLIKQRNNQLKLNKQNRLYYEQSLLFISQYPNKQKIKNISVKQAHQGFLKLKKQQAFKTCSNKIIEFINGYYWTKLNDPNDFYREAILMNNCLVTKIQDKNLQYFSLRTNNNNSIINVSVDFSQNIIVEAKERNNKDISEYNQIYILALSKFYKLKKSKFSFLQQFFINLKLKKITRVLNEINNN